MKKIILFFIILNSTISYSQEIMELSHNNFKFKVLKESIKNGSTISKIIVFENDKQIQIIIPEENSFYSLMTADKVIELIDMNFDHSLDIRLIQSIPGERGLPCYHWIYNKTSKRFERKPEFDKITNPIFNTKDKTITSTSQGYLREVYKNTYKIENNKLILVEKYIEEVIGKGKKSFKNWKLLNGKFKLINEGIIPLK